MDDADMPADNPPDDSPAEEAAGAAEHPTGGRAADPGQGSTESKSAAAAGAASKLSEDTAMPTPTASKAVQQLVHPPSSLLTDTHVITPWGPAFYGKPDSAAAVQLLSGRPPLTDLHML